MSKPITVEVYFVVHFVLICRSTKENLKQRRCSIFTWMLQGTCSFLRAAKGGGVSLPLLHKLEANGGIAYLPSLLITSMNKTLLCLFGTCLKKTSSSVRTACRDANAVTNLPLLHPPTAHHQPALVQEPYKKGKWGRKTTYHLPSLGRKDDSRIPNVGGQIIFYHYWHGDHYWANSSSFYYCL